MTGNPTPELMRMVLDVTDLEKISEICTETTDYIVSQAREAGGGEASLKLSFLYRSNVRVTLTLEIGHGEEEAEVLIEHDLFGPPFFQDPNQQ